MNIAPIDEQRAHGIRIEEDTFTGNRPTDDQRLRNLSAVVGAKVTQVRVEDGRLVLVMLFDDEILPTEIFNLEVDFATAEITPN